MRAICERAAAKGAGGSATERMVGDFYASGMDEAAIDRAGLTPLKPELDHIANEIFVNLPWGSLMRGIILADDRVIEAIARLANPGAIVRIILNTRIFDDPIPNEARDLPELTPDYVRLTLAPAFARAHVKIGEVRYLSPEEVGALETTWAKRLSHRRPPPSVLIDAHMRNEGIDVPREHER